jgi:predicted nucleic acid-binding Zn ribbon protein
MRKKKTQSRLHSIGEILFSSFKGKGVAAKIEENSLIKLWHKAVGQQIVLQTQPDCFKNGTLFVKTTSSVWVQQLHFMKDEILHKLNELAGKIAVKDIRFSVGHKLAQIKTDANIPTAKKSLLKERDKKMIAECTAALADRELAIIFKRVMQAEINRRRRWENEQAR